MKIINIEISADELLSADGEILIRLVAPGSTATAGTTVTASTTATTSCAVTVDAAARPAYPMLRPFVEQLVEELRSVGRVRTAETYHSALNSFMRYREDADICMADIDDTLAQHYERWLKNNNVKPNSTSFYMRVLRAIYNRAVNATGMTDRRPFTKVYTGIDQTMKRAVDVDAIRRLRALPLSDPKAAFARDMFMFSFYTQGMAFVDMAYLQKSDIADGLLVYHRHKTGQRVCIRWTPQMQAIVDRHPAYTDRYLLPIIRSCTGKERSQMRRCQYHVNNELAALSAIVGIQPKLTMYCARHSWATIAQSINVPVEVISRGMGHNNEQTTRIYLKEIDVGRVAEANRRVLDLIGC